MKLLGITLFLGGILIKIFTSLNLFAWILIITGFLVLVFGYLTERKR
jgi:uncharacterized membrane protein YgdD (TMEM256/DUF423 family)